MTEDLKSKKVRIYKFATEYNLSADTLVEFLQKKGYDVKSHVSLLNEEMLAEIEVYFKKDIEKAEKHYRKISEFNKKRTEKGGEISAGKEEKHAELPEGGHASAVSEATDENRSEEIEVWTEEETAEQSAFNQEETQEQAHSKEHQPVQPPEDVSDEAVEVNVQAEEDAGQVHVVTDEPEETLVKDVAVPTDEATTETPGVKIYKTRTERNLANNKGLTIIGKIDLDARRKKTEPQKPPERGAYTDKNRGDNRNRPDERVVRADQQRPGTDRPQQQKPANINGSTLKPASLTTQEDVLKKKKKKPKAKKKVGTSVAVEEPASVTKKKKFKKVEVDKRDVDEAIKRTLLSTEDSVTADRASNRKKKKKEKAEENERRAEERLVDDLKLKVTEFIAVNELANLMNIPVGDVMAKCIGLGIMVSINQRLDVETITLVADEFGFEIELEDEYTSEELEDVQDAPGDLKPRPPVVTIMGHVDHGKTSLLDRIRSANVVAGESGGITQHIGAYQVDVGNDKHITFLDTPGHEAFTAMRARGAKVADIVILIVAADDAVMPQTVEAINHAQAASVPIIIAINKIDKPGANPDKIKQQLADRNILVEDWGGHHQCVEISAKSGLNIDALLEKVLLEAEILELKANPDRLSRGTVIESQLDKGRGITGTILIEKGTLKIGDPFVAGVNFGRVRAMFDERNRKINSVGPATPVLVLGFEGAPQAGDTFVVLSSERDARNISIKRQQLKREQDQRQIHHITLDEIAHQISMGGIKELPLIVKGDVDGSVEALSDSLMKLSNEEVIVRVIHKGVGGISEGDVLLAAASGAIIIGFHVRPNINARKLSENEKVDIRLYNVIYDAIDEVKSALEGLLSPIISEEVTATVEIRDTFKVPKAGTIAGCYVLEGKVTRTNKVRLIRQGIVLFEGELASLRRFKDDVKEVDAGYECGLNLNNFNDVKVGDIIEAYKFVETKKKLV
ncbi:MAG: translation initiation factor IF-2 [Ignavibacteria bacterium]